MIVWLDQLIFGNGHGLKSPFFDDRYYWLSGEFYTWHGWLGSQLQSFQWTHPRPGETRKLAGRDYRVFHSVRSGLRVRVSWATKLPDDLDKAHALLRQIQSDLGTA